MILVDSDEGEAVAEREDDGGETGMGGYVGVESIEPEGLRVVVFDGVVDLAVPESVVGDDKCAWAQSGEQKVEIGDVVAFVGVDIYKVPVFMQSRDNLEGVAYMERDAVSAG